MRRKLHKVIRWLLLLVGAACAALILGTVVPRPLLDQAVSSDAPARRILVLASPIHTDIAVPIDATTLGEFSFLRDAGLPVDDPNARWMLFGWGSRAYYMATPELSDTTVGPLFKALTLDASVMHVEILGPIDETHAAVSGFTVSQAGLEPHARLHPRKLCRDQRRAAPHRRRALWRRGRLLRGEWLVQRADRLQYLDGAGAAPSRAANRLVEPAAANARLLAGAA